MLDQFSEHRIAADVASFVVRHDHDLFFTKTLDWQSEHEFRVTLMTNVEGEEAEFVHVPFRDAASVRAVILGEQFPEWQFPAAKWACEQVGVTASDSSVGGWVALANAYELDAGEGADPRGVALPRWDPDGTLTSRHPAWLPCARPRPRYPYGRSGVPWPSSGAKPRRTAVSLPTMPSGPQHEPLLADDRTHPVRRCGPGPVRSGGHVRSVGVGPGRTE
jgi:hypothetical protein